ncbi:hypothetical protein CI807_30285 [Pseudomonas sp. NS1(2017)]|uniref:hypothetical protein n=1 Tax=Pseudomonas sp. NS1(2017) TaxID=2025658 RepID=UPI000BA2736B|nr:hypothetical protein [Pseudomonas sp. NS1(2017)]ASV40316.1 hypothetical protein CI807_30285 [Pseudomonas sp. NS1(2017)]
MTEKNEPTQVLPPRIDKPEVDATVTSPVTISGAVPLSGATITVEDSTGTLGVVTATGQSWSLSVVMTPGAKNIRAYVSFPVVSGSVQRKFVVS